MDNRLRPCLLLSALLGPSAVFALADSALRGLSRRQFRRDTTCRRAGWVFLR